MMTGDSYQARVRHWSRLRTKLKEIEKPGVGNVRLILGLELQKLRTAKRRQEALSVERVRATQELNQQFAATRELVSRIHSLLKAALGPRDPRLVSLGVYVPSRPKSLRKRPPGEAKKTAPPATTPTAKP